MTTATNRSSGTVVDMASRVVMTQRRPLDQRRLLTPRDYLVNPDLFGEVRDAVSWCPPDGDSVSLQIARTLHVYVCAWRHAAGRPSGAELARRFGFSRQTWSHVARGHRWPPCTVLTALLTSLREATSVNAATAPGRPVPQRGGTSTSRVQSRK